MEYGNNRSVYLLDIQTFSITPFNWMVLFKYLNVEKKKCSKWFVQWMCSLARKFGNFVSNNFKCVVDLSIFMLRRVFSDYSNSINYVQSAVKCAKIYWSRQFDHTLTFTVQFKTLFTKVSSIKSTLNFVLLKSVLLSLLLLFTMYGITKSFNPLT